jgi:tetratricopeptide (TPR) repeat protein
MPAERTRALLLALLPAGAALAFHANTIPGDFVFDDVVLIERGAELRDMDARRIFLSNYWGPSYEDRNWRPLTLLSYALNFPLGSGPASFHVVNVLLYAACCVIVHLVLARLLGDRALAAAGACVFAALPIHTEAVANVVGRAEILSALAIFGAWLVAGPGGARAGAGAIVFAGLLTFLGLCTKENTAVVPALMVAGAWILGRRIPWAAAAASTASIGLYLAVRAWVLRSHSTPITIVDNPLAFTDAATAAMNGLRLLGLYLAKTVAPVHLAADYSLGQLPVLPLSSARLWAEAGAVALILVAVPLIFLRRKPLLALAAIFFVITIAPTSNVLFRIGTIFGERLAFTPSFAWPLALCALAGSAALSRRRTAAIAALALLTAVYGARSFERNRDWADSAAMNIRMAADSPGSTRSQLKAADGYVLLFRTADPAEKKGLLEKAIEHIRASLAIHPEHGRAIAKHGEVLLLQGKYAEGVDRLTEALVVMGRQDPPEFEPIILNLRGQCYLRLEKFPEAYRDFTEYLERMRNRRAKPDGASLNFQAVALAAQGGLKEALPVFDRAVELGPEVPEIRSNRGFCRYQLGDRAGALADYERGLEICRQKGFLYTPGEDCVFSFLLRIAKLEEDETSARRSAGDEAGASRLAASAARRRAEAAALAGKASGRAGS